MKNWRESDINSGELPPGQHHEGHPRDQAHRRLSPVAGAVSGVAFVALAGGR